MSAVIHNTERFTRNSVENRWISVKTLTQF